MKNKEQTENSFKLTQTDKKVLNAYAERISNLMPKKTLKEDDYRMIHK